MEREDVRLYRERRWTTDGRMLIDTLLPVDPIPLMGNGWGGGHCGSRLRGTVTNVRRIRSGWVLGTLRSWELDLTGWCCEPDFAAPNGIVEQRWGDRTGMIMDRPILRSITLGKMPCWPGMRIK